MRESHEGSSEHLLRYQDVAKRLGVSARTVRNWCSDRSRAPEGFPRPGRLGRLPVFRESDIEQFITSLHSLQRDATQVNT
jgi:predicted DNA-binding transcriptional regulator AlpA